MIVFAHNITDRGNITRLELDIYGASEHRARTLTAAVYRIAARLEEGAATFGFTFSVSVCKAKLGILELAYTPGGMDGDGMDTDTAEDLVMDACSTEEIYPLDLLVSTGEIDPVTAEAL